MNQNWDKNKAVLAVGSLIALLAILFILPPPRKVDVERAPVSEGPSLVTERIRETKEEPKYLIDAEYPRIEGLSDADVENKVNQELKSQAERAVNDFKNGFGETQFSEEEMQRESRIEIRYKTGYANDYLLSVSSETYYDVVGAAHPSAETRTFNYDLRSGKELSLADLFTVGSDYLKAISDYAMADLRNQVGHDEAAVSRIDEGAGPDLRNYENFLITPEGLVIIFNPYQVAPGAGGTLKVSIPYAIVDKFVSPAGVLPLRS